MTNDELMAAVAKGDQGAFAELVRLHGDRLIGWLSSRVGTDYAMDAEDIAQETWLRVLRGAGGYSARGEFVAWLYRVARNILGDKAKARRRSALGHVAAEFDEDVRILDSVPGDELDAADLADRHEIVERLEAMCDYLTAEQAEVLRGVAAGESLSEIADRMGRPCGTVKGYKRQAVGRLREMLAAG